MLVSIKQVPVKYSASRNAVRMAAVEEFLKGGDACAEYRPEDGDTPRRAYNGILMAVRRKYPNRVTVFWRQGKIFLQKKI